MSQQALIGKQLSPLQSPEDTDDDGSKVVSHQLPTSSHITDPDSRIEFLERNLQYIQQQHQLTLVDLHDEINRLQQENTDLHYRLSNIQSSSSSQQKQRTSDELSLDNNHPNLEQQLIESEQKNKYLMHKIDQLLSRFGVTDIDDIKTPRPTADIDHQHLLSVTDDNQQHIQEIAKLQSALIEILNTERLSIASKVLLRDCLTPTNMNKTTTTPIDVLFINENQPQKPAFASSTSGKTSSLRQSASQHRLVEQRANLPPIVQINSPLLRDSTGVSSLLQYSLSPTNYSQLQHLTKVGETPIARRERRTHELQKNRLLRNLYH